jgi:hypothetical protein
MILKIFSPKNLAKKFSEKIVVFDSKQSHILKIT